MEKLSYFLNSVIPKKFIIWIVSLILFLIGLIEAGQFVTITVAYIGANTIAKYTPKAKALANKLK
jgi:hypothetical protein